MDVLGDALLQIQLLGGFAVVVRGRSVGDEAWRLRRARTLIKLLVLAPDRRMHRERLMELLWPDGEPTPNSLHQVLYTARRALGEAPVQLAMHDSVVTLTADDLWVDVDAFEEQAAVARRSRAVADYRAALALYGGELLPEDRYEDWAQARREALRETQLALMVELAALLAEAGERVAAVETLQRVVVEDPLHEAAQRALMRLFATDGRSQQALARYEQLRDVLRRELGADPDPQTRELYREILAGQHDPDAGAPPSRLPRRLTGFVGRERELAELERLLGDAQLLTLTGPGGCGKTRLALELAARCEPGFARGARLVELAAIRDPALVVGETATAVGVQLRSQGDPITTLAAEIGDASLLLVLDNCEHLIDRCATLVAGLLSACPNLRVLATSRERLRIPGETAWRVPSLSLPPDVAHIRAADLEHSEAVRLFCQRATAFTLSDDNAAAVAEICRRLDGMPLALELAAARMEVLAPAQIAARLGDALTLLRRGSRTGLTRQQSLRATLEWSHDLLSEPEQALYRRLGVFAGDFGVDAVERICTGPPVGDSDALDLLAELAEKSLVNVEPGADGHRYRLLDTIRQHAGERLAAVGEKARAEAAHRAWYLALAEAADRDVDPAVASAWPADRLEAEHDDLRAALASAIRHDPPMALRLAAALWWFWMARGYFREAVQRLEEALAAAPAPTPQRARTLFAAAGMTLRLHSGHVDRIVALCAEGVEIARACGDRHAVARALERQGVAVMGAFEFAAAERAFAEGLELAAAIGDRDVAVAITQAQGVLAACRGENGAARALLAESLALLDEVEDDRTPLFWASHVSPVVIPSGRDGAPRMFFEDTFVLLRSVARRAGIGHVLCNVAEAWRADGEYAAARESLDRALALFRDIGDPLGAAVALNALGNLARSTGEFSAGRAWFEEALTLRRTACDQREIGTTLAGAGLLALYAGDDDGHRLIGEAVRMFARTSDGPGMQLTPLNVAGFELDRGDPQVACEMLERIAQRAENVYVRSRGWAAAELAEAALAIGDTDRARRAAAAALVSFEGLGEARGVRYVRGLDPRGEWLLSARP